ncbi:MAG: asparagine synthetase B, partial [Odoribacter sp.]|nr:asparagine synthetase B [Odoribacter sp.]
MRIGLLLMFIWLTVGVKANYLLIPMDQSQSNHLKAYGIAYHALKQGYEIHWLLNYRGGSFVLPFDAENRTECLLKGVGFEVIPPARFNAILSEIAVPEVNADAVKLEKAPKIAVYSPKEKKPWDDAVTLALTYAEIPYDVVYDSEILDGKLKNYDWLHLHHEDFTGQMGKFYRNYRHMEWYKAEEAANQQTAKKYGYAKISELKKAVVRTIRDYVANGGFMFAMCSATDTYDIALAAMDVDICDVMFDGDPADPDAQAKLDYSKTFAFKDFKLELNPNVYEYSDIDVTEGRKVPEKEDY